MKVLVLEWDSFGHEYMMEALETEGCEICYVPWPFGETSMRDNPDLEARLSSRMESENVHFVFSFNFFPVAAKVCHQYGTPYVSWVYDSPFRLLYSRHIDHRTSQVYVFDQSIAREFQKQGHRQVQYLPMAAPVAYYDRMESLDPEETEGPEISFVGSTYSGQEHDFFHYLEHSDDHTRGYVRALLDVQKMISGAFLLEDGLTEDIVSRLAKVCPLGKEPDEWESDAWLYANYFLARKLTSEERIEYLEALAEKHQVRLYTADKGKTLQGVEQYGTVDYLTEMPRVFKKSRINLNISLRSIHTGIPLRAMEIMGCGGFLLTNFQEDFLEWFEPGVDYVYYTDKEDLLAKASYYLEHPEERKQIAANGYQKVREAHTYSHRCRTILERVMPPKEQMLNDRICELEAWRKQQGGCWYHMEIPWETLSEEQLMAETDRQMQWMAQEKELLFEIRDLLLELVDQRLASGQESDYEQLGDLFRKNIVRDLYIVFPEIFYLYIFLKQYQIEQQQGEKNHIFRRYTSYKELVALYKKLTFYIRRLDSHLEDHYRTELWDWMRREQIPELAVYMVWKSNVNLESERIAACLKQGMERGHTKE